MKRHLTLTFIMIMAFSLLFIGQGCGKKETDVIKIGVSLPLTGDAAVWGNSQKEGYDLALGQINGSGGINGKKIKLIYGDDKGIPNEGVSLLRKFISIDKINILTGVANSSVALAYIPIINDNKILFVSSGASSPKLTGSSKYFFRTWPSDIAEAHVMAIYAYDELRIKEVAILYINNDYGIGLVEPFCKKYINLGGKIIADERFEQSSTDFRTQLTKIKNKKPEAIYLAGNPIEMGRSIKQAKELGVNCQILSISTLNDPEVFKITGNEAIESTIITDASFNPNSTDPQAQKFLHDFRQKFKKEPGILANTAYDALLVISYGIENVGTDTDALQKFLHSLKEYQGVSGLLSFSSGGDINRPIRIAKAIEGKYINIIENYRWY